MSDYIAATTTTDSTGITWTSDGYYVVGDTDWQDIVFTSIVTYNGGTIGIVPRVYESNMYMILTLENAETAAGTQAHAVLNAQVTYDLIHLADKYLAGLVIGQSYTMKAEITGTNYKIYLNDVLIFNIEYSSMARGQVGVYATSGNKCTNINVDSAFPDGWTSNVSSVGGTIVGVDELENDDKYIHLKQNSGATALYIQQQIAVTANKSYTLSYTTLGNGTAYIIENNGASPKTYNATIQDVDWAPHSFTQKLSSDCTSVTIRFSVLSQDLKVNGVQFEQKAYSTGYIENVSATDVAVRDSSLITYPAKDNINSESGSLSMWVKPSVTYTSTSINPNPVIFDYGSDAQVIRVEYTGTDIQFHYGVLSSVSIPTTFVKDTWYHIVATWGWEGIGLYVNDVYVSAAGVTALDIKADVINFGQAWDGSRTTFYGAIDETIIYKNIIEAEEVAAIYNSVEPIADSASMIMRATFNYAIGNFNKALMELTPAPQYGSPVVVEREDGTPLNKVSFFDYETGEYRTWNEEQVWYDGKSDYLVVSYKNIDTENFEITVKDKDGALYGNPYTVDGYRIYISLTDDEKADLAGQTLRVAYQLEDAYTVDFNIGVPDSFRLNVGKYNGQPISVYYEGNDFQTEKLATMIELNPLLNPNHQGFLYITNNIEKVTSFKAKASMNDLPANGVSETLVVIEPLDMYGNYISHLQLDVTAEKGMIIPAYDVDSIKIRERAGRYLYKYTAPKIMFTDNGLLEEEDQINIIDNETGLGTQIPMTLITLQNLSHVIVKGDTINSLADKYGVTEEDIIVGNPSITNVDSYVTSNVGSSINIPVNYSATLMTKTKEEITEEPMIGHLVNKICQYMDEKADDLPTGLGPILDFNTDGLINIDEVQWLNDNKLTGTIQPKYTALKEWEINNAG